MASIRDLLARAYVRASNYQMPITLAYEYADYDLKTKE